MINYDVHVPGFENWVIEEESFNDAVLGKTESIMVQGNGYIGLRASNEELYPQTKRGMFINGTFNKTLEEEVTELPNAADLLNLSIKIDGKLFNLSHGEIEKYKKQLNLKNGELTRTFNWKFNDIKLKFNFKRLVSIENHRLIAQYYEIENIGEQAHELEIISGIDGQQTNSGAMHFNDGEKRLIDGEVLQMHTKTNESNIDFIYHMIQDVPEGTDKLIMMERRQIVQRFKNTINPGEKFTCKKIATVTTSRDIDYIDIEKENLLEVAEKEFKTLYKKSYDELLLESSYIWDEYYNEQGIEIEGNDLDQLAINFVLYHLRCFTPANDPRMNVGAKGLSGEGYKGHAFWDTEIFVLPTQIFGNPKVARNLLEYRYLGLEGARKKARDNQYKGAQYPWEAAWITDGEVTPVWGAADIVTGKATKIWSGFIEQHISADVVYGVWLYEKVTKDQEFMEKYGYEIIFETATFWASRGEYNEESKKYEINGVIGPDEYKEHVNNDAFTNYMAKFNVDYALEIVSRLEENELIETYREFIHKDMWEDFSKNVFLPRTNNEGLLPQNDTFLSLDRIDLTDYKNQETVGKLFEDYSLDQVNQMQICKQADVLLLLLLKEELFTESEKKANWDFYEPITMHDSSLSLSTHAILAGDMKNADLADELFKRACNIDLGPNPKSSDHGIHAASIAGIWQCVVYGYAGVRMVEDHLRVVPSLKRDWKNLKFNIKYQGSKLEFEMKQDEFYVSNHGVNDINLEVSNKKIITIPAGEKIKIGG